MGRCCFRRCFSSVQWQVCTFTYMILHLPPHHSQSNTLTLQGTLPLPPLVPPRVPLPEGHRAHCPPPAPALQPVRWCSQSLHLSDGETEAWEVQPHSGCLTGAGLAASAHSAAPGCTLSSSWLHPQLRHAPESLSFSPTGTFGAHLKHLGLVSPPLSEACQPLLGFSPASHKPHETRL